MLLTLLTSSSFEASQPRALSSEWPEVEGSMSLLEFMSKQLVEHLDSEGVHIEQEALGAEGNNDLAKVEDGSLDGKGEDGSWDSSQLGHRHRLAREHITP